MSVLAGHPRAGGRQVGDAAGVRRDRVVVELDDDIDALGVGALRRAPHPTSARVGRLADLKPCDAARTASSPVAGEVGCPAHGAAAGMTEAKMRGDAERTRQHQSTMGSRRHVPSGCRPMGSRVHDSRRRHARRRRDLGRIGSRNERRASGRATARRVAEPGSGRGAVVRPSAASGVSLASADRPPHDGRPRERPAPDARVMCRGVYSGRRSPLSSRIAAAPRRRDEGGAPTHHPARLRTSATPRVPSTAMTHLPSRRSRTAPRRSEAP